MIGEVNLNSIENKEIRKFGIIACIFFGCLGALGIWAKKILPVCLFGFLTILGIGFIIMPFRLRPLYAGWMKVANLLSRVVNGSILALSYYLVITPSALIKRLFGGRPLPVKPDKNIRSYWVDRTEPSQQKERFSKRF